jgi:predicted AAA+ superfamily ATPase
MDKESREVLGLLKLMNPWWKNSPVPEHMYEGHRRYRFFYLDRKVTSGKDMITVRGPRKVGKTTVIGQLIDMLLPDDISRHENGAMRPCDPEKILYLNMDNSRILPEPGMRLKHLLRVYQQSVLGEHIRDSNEHIYVFIDEIQRISDWEKILKYYPEEYSDGTFVIAGPGRSLIGEKITEYLSGSGSLKNYSLYPMSFSEYVEYKIRTENTFEDENEGESAVQGEFLRRIERIATLEMSLEKGNKKQLFGKLNSQRNLLGRPDTKMKSLKDTYMTKGGYPGVVDQDYASTYSILDSHIRSTVRDDISSTYSVEKTRSLFAILNMCAQSSGQKMNVQDIADSTDINRDTVERYLGYLSEFSLIDIVPYYDSGSESGGRDKVYMRDVGYLNTLRGTLSEDHLHSRETMSMALKTVCLDVLRRIQTQLSDTKDDTVSYWDRKGEVDFVISGKGYTLPVETETGDPKGGDLGGIRDFIDDNRYGADFGIVVSEKDGLKREDGLIYVPSWLFFLMR